MLYISIFCIFCRFFCLLTIKIFFPKKKSNIVKDFQLQHKLFSTHTVRYQFSRVKEVCFYSFLETVCSNCTFKLIWQTVPSHRCTSIH